MLRIIAGERRGTRLHTLEGASTRPLRGRVREALFNILQFDVPDAEVLDLFAGSGAVGLEALSRGARHATFVEDSRAAQDVIRRNIAKLRYEERATLVGRRLPEALHAMRPPRPFTLVFVMPPYGSGLVEATLEALRGPGLLAEEAQVIVEIECREALAIDEAQWATAFDRRYGVTRLIALRPRRAE